MQPVLILYATREGQTRRIAEHIAEAVRARGLPVDLLNAAHLPAAFSLTAYSTALVAASVHVGQHEKEVVDFVKSHLWELESMPAAFLSVSLSEAGAEDLEASPERRAKSGAEVQEMIQRFLKKTGWHPSRIKAIAGALMYSEYNFLVRFVMKRIAAAEGASTDTSRDHEYTDWMALDRFVDEFLQLGAANQHETSRAAPL